MKWFYNWKTFYKINALVLVMVVFMLGLSFMGYYFYNQSKVAMNDAYSNALISVKLINDANANMRMMRSVNVELILAPLDASKKQSLLIQTTVLKGLTTVSQLRLLKMDKGLLLRPLSKWATSAGGLELLKKLSPYWLRALNR